MKQTRKHCVTFSDLSLVRFSNSKLISMMLNGTLHFHACIFRKYSTLMPIQKQISIHINHTTYNDSLAAVVSTCNHFLLKFMSLNVCFGFPP